MSEHLSFVTSRIALAGLLALTGCQHPDSPPDPAAATSAVPTAKASDGALAVGDPAPDVTLVLHDGKQVPLASRRGSMTVLYFYPKDDTAGCRVEAQGIRDHWKDFEAAGIAVYGVSLQDAESHQAFIDKESLPFPLVVDTDGKIAAAFRVPVKGEYAKRQTFLIGKDGKIARVWLDVSPAGHAEELLDAAKTP